MPKFDCGTRIRAIALSSCAKQEIYGRGRSDVCVLLHNPIVFIMFLCKNRGLGLLALMAQGCEKSQDIINHRTTNPGKCRPAVKRNRSSKTLSTEVSPIPRFPHKNRKANSISSPPASAASVMPYLPPLSHFYNRKLVVRRTQRLADTLPGRSPSPETFAMAGSRWKNRSTAVRQ